jgi:putative peptidoglycan lipid II flippase
VTDVEVERGLEVDADPALAGLDGQPPDSGAPESTRALVGRAAMVILLATVVGRLLGLFRDQAVAYFFGAKSVTDAFFLAYKLPYLLSLTVAGALTATFIPVFTQRLVKKQEDEAWKLSVSMTNAAAIVLLGLSVLCVIFARWLVPLFAPGFRTEPRTMALAISLFRILMIGVIFDGLAGLAIGVFNSLKKFALPAFAPAVGTVATIAVIVVFAQTAWGISSVAWGSVVGSAVGFLILFPALRRYGMRYRPKVEWRLPGMAEVGMMVWPILIGSAVGKVSIFVDQVLGSLIGTGAISALNYSEKLFQMPLGLFVAGITIPIFPLLSEHVAANQPGKLKVTLNFALRLIAFVMIPASIGLIVLRTPIIAFLFQHGKFTADDTARTGWALLFYSIGLFSYAGRDTLTRVFYAYHDTRTPVKISVAAVGINIVCSYLLMHVIGVGGLAFGTTIALTVNFVVLIQLLRRKLGPMLFGSFFRSFARILAASAVMGVAVWGLDVALARYLEPGTVSLGIRVVIGLGVGSVVYFAIAYAARFPEAHEIVSMFKAILPRRPGKGGQEDPA